jgi:hypothetical protein
MFNVCASAEPPPPPSPFGDERPRWVSTHEVKQHVKLRSVDIARLSISQRPVQRAASTASDGTGGLLTRTRSLAPQPYARATAGAAAPAEPPRRANSFDSARDSSGEPQPSGGLRDIFFGRDVFGSSEGGAYGGFGGASDVASVVSSSRAFVQDDVEYKVRGLLRSAGPALPHLRDKLLNIYRIVSMG